MQNSSKSMSIGRLFTGFLWVLNCSYCLAPAHKYFLQFFFNRSPSDADLRSKSLSNMHVNWPTFHRFLVNFELLFPKSKESWFFIASLVFSVSNLCRRSLFFLQLKLPYFSVVSLLIGPIKTQSLIIPNSSHNTILSTPDLLVARAELKRNSAVSNLN